MYTSFQAIVYLKESKKKKKKKEKKQQKNKQTNKKKTKKNWRQMSSEIRHRKS